MLRVAITVGVWTGVSDLPSVKEGNPTGGQEPHKISGESKNHSAFLRYLHRWSSLERSQI